MKHTLVCCIIAALSVIALRAQTGKLGNQSPAGRDEWKLRAEGCDLYVTEFGVGDTVVVLHGGWGAEHSYLIDAVTPLAGRHHFVMYDQRGSLRSRCADSLVSIEEHIADLERLRLALGVERLTIVAHSMGGYLAMRYMQEHPGRVRRLVLVGSIPARGAVEDLTTKLTGPTLDRWKRGSTLAALSAAGLSPEPDAPRSDRERSTWHRITFAAINLHDPARWRELSGSLFYSNEAALAAIRTMPDTWDFTPALLRESVPVTLIVGDDDYIPFELHRAWLPSVPAVRTITIAKAGHCPWIDDRSGFEAALGSGLGERGSGDGR